MPFTARCTATLAGDELVLTMLNGTEHSRIAVDDGMDAAEALQRLSDGTMPVRLLWTVDRTGADPDRLALMSGRGDLNDVPVPTVPGTHCVQRP